MIHFLNASNFILQNIDINSPELKNTNYDAMVLLIKANWCGHCRRFFPEYEQQSIKNKNIGYMVVEEEDNETLLTYWKNLAYPAFEVDSFPTVKLYYPTGEPKIGEVDRTQLQSEIDLFLRK